MPSIFPALFAYQEIAPFLIRLILAAVFIKHGYPKLFGSYTTTVQFFNSQGIKPAKIWVIIVGIAEFFGGIFLLLGLFTQIAAGIIALVMLGAIAFVKRKYGFAGGYEFDLALLVLALSLLVLDPGIFSFDVPF